MNLPLNTDLTGKVAVVTGAAGTLCSVFSKALGGWFDIVVAMYHDQGHIPLKVKGFVYDRDADRWQAVAGVNVTLGLPIIRASVDHGTGFGHAGDGNLHIYCCANDMALDEFKRRSKAVMDKCYAKCIEFGGQVSGEHAIGHAKKQYLVESVGETAFGLMQAIKQVFDPKGILNPGKVCTNVEEG